MTSVAQTPSHVIRLSRDPCSSHRASRIVAPFLVVLLLIAVPLYGSEAIRLQTEAVPSYVPGRAPTGFTTGAPDDILAPLPVPDPLAPPLVDTFQSFTFDDNPVENSGFYFIPPDPHGAVGPNHLVSIVNVMIEWRDKSGALQFRDALQDFFSPLTPVNFLFDPKVLYDQYAGRYLAVALEKQDTSDGDPVNSSRILLAVSDDNDPNGTWYFAQINGRMTINTVDSWADYPGFAVDEEAVYVSTNMFPFGGGAFQGSRLWIIAKGMGGGGWYDNGPAAINGSNPSDLAGLPDDAFTIQPAHMFGAAPAGLGTFLVGSGWFSGATDFLSIIQIDNPLGATTFTNTFLDVGDTTDGGPIPGAPQMGSATTIETVGDRVYNAVWRNGRLWAVNTVSPPAGADAGQATAHFYEIDTSGMTLVQQGNVGGEDIAAGTHTYMPAVMVDPNGNMGITFAASGPSLYAGAYYTARLSSDPAGTVQPAAVYGPGVAPYVRTFPPSTRNRWGDYFGIALDPVDDKIWVFGQYAGAQGTAGVGNGDGRWMTLWGCFGFNEPPVAVCQDVMKAADATCMASVTASEVDNGSFDPDGGTLSLDLNPPGPFPLGDTPVTLTVTDDTGLSDFCTATITVFDNTPPQITCPMDVTVECTAPNGTPRNDPLLAPFFAGVSATDNCGAPTITDDAPPLFPLGPTTVTFTATDAAGAMDQCQAVVTVVDTTPPVLNVTLSPAMLWPPNHRMVDITATVTVADTCCPNPVFELISATSNEPDNGIGDGNTDNDIQGVDVGTPDTEFQLRSERAGGGDGRIYTVVYMATDCSGNATISQAEVRVPHDRSGSAMATAGFNNLGTALQDDVPTFSLAVTSQAGFLPTTIITSEAYVGNYLGALQPMSYRYRDVNGDGTNDLELSYDTAALRFLKAESGKILVGLHYETGDGTTYIVRNIFDLGPPLPEFEKVGDDEPSPVVEDATGDEPGGAWTDVTGTTSLDLPAAGRVTVDVFSIQGRKIRTLFDSDHSAGSFEIQWDGRDDSGRRMASGIYFYRVIGPETHLVRKVLIAR